MQGRHSNMDASGRRAAPTQQIQALTNINAELHAANTQLTKANTDLKAANDLQEKKIKFLQVATTISLASNGGLRVGLATRMQELLFRLP